VVGDDGPGESDLAFVYATRKSKPPELGCRPGKQWTKGSVASSDRVSVGQRSHALLSAEQSAGMLLD
jgi:hypothetical protein